MDRKLLLPYTLNTSQQEVSQKLSGQVAEVVDVVTGGSSTRKEIGEGNR